MRLPAALVKGFSRRVAPERASGQDYRAEPGGVLPERRIGLVIGTRPEAIKLAPVAHALIRAGARPHLYLTGQHPGLEPADHELSGFRATPLGQHGLPDPIEHAERVAHSLERAWHGSPPALVMVQGDTSSALGGARAAAALKLPLAHVEAGLRTHDAQTPWPEEGFRVEIDRLADLLFAPTLISAANIGPEGCKGEVHITGNTGIDALLEVVRRGRLPRRKPPGRGPLKLLVTCHRRESWGAGFAAVAAALTELAQRRIATIDVVLHPNPQVSEAMYALLGQADGIRLLPPLSHGAMIAAMTEADLLLSDSGGVQEEAPTLGIPLLVLREKTERPEGVRLGAMRLVGTDTARIVGEVERLAGDRAGLAKMGEPGFPYGDGRAAARIVAVALDWLDRRDPSAECALTA